MGASHRCCIVSGPDRSGGFLSADPKCNLGGWEAMHCTGLEASCETSRVKGECKRGCRRMPA